MLIEYKEGYSFFHRVIAIVIICLFVHNDIAFALAPQLRLPQETFNDEYLAGYTKLAHAAINNNIKSKLPPGGIEELKSTHPDDVDDTKKIRVGNEFQKIIIVAIPDLVKDTGQLAHIGLGRQLGMSIIYIDKKYFNNETLRNHEKNKIAKWETRRKDLGKTYSQMREWILNPATHSDAVKFASQVDLETKPGAKKIYETVNGLIDLDNIYTLYSEYGLDRTDTDINIAAGNGVVPFNEGPLVENLEIRNKISENWIEKNIPELKGKTVLSLSMEGNIPEFEGLPAQDANTKGGLGAYFGDKFDGFDDLGMNAIGIQPGYTYDRNTGQKIDYDALVKAGILEEVVFNYPLTAWNGMEDPVLAYIVGKGKDDPGYKEWIECVDRGNVAFKIKVYSIKRQGASKRYLLVSPIFDYLYCDEETNPGFGKIHRFCQEVAFGKGVYELCTKMKITPDILHLNEGHTVVAAVEMRSDSNFNNMAIVYTNHTLVPGGLEKFSTKDVRRNIEPYVANRGEINSSKIINRVKYMIGKGGSKHLASFLYKALDQNGNPVKEIDESGKEQDVYVVDFSTAAVELADVINAVSEEHAIATKKMFDEILKMKQYEEDAAARREGRAPVKRKIINVDVVPVLNGSGRTWVMDDLLKLQAEGRYPAPGQLWELHEKAKSEVCFKDIFERTGVKLSPDKATAWVVRRLVEYKSQYPMLRFLVHVLTADRDKTFTREELKTAWFRDIPDLAQGYNRGIVDSTLDKIFCQGKRDIVHGLGMQIVVGAPTPEYVGFWADEFRRWTYAVSSLKGRFVYVSGSDAKFLKMQAIGSDICINMPRPLEEACGTSDQRSGLNGGVNIAIRGAGPVEWITDYRKQPGKNWWDGSGFLIGSYTRKTGAGRSPKLTRFYHDAPGDIFAKCEIASNIFYDDKEEWKRLMHNSYMAATYGKYLDKENNEVIKKAVTAGAMEMRYAKDAYPSAMRKRRDSKTIYEFSDKAVRLIPPCPDKDEIGRLIAEISKKENDKIFKKLAELGSKDSSNLFAIFFSFNSNEDIDSFLTAVKADDTIPENAARMIAFYSRNFIIDNPRQPTRIVCQIPLMTVTASGADKMLDLLKLPVGSYVHLLGALRYGEISKKIATNDREKEGPYKGFFVSMPGGTDSAVTIVVRDTGSVNDDEIKKGHRQGSPFSVYDPFEISADVGGEGALNSLCDKLRSRGSMPIIDIVGQFSPDSPMVIEHPEWMRGRQIVGDEENIRDVDLINGNPGCFLLARGGQRWLIEHNRDWLSPGSGWWTDTAAPDWDNKDLRNYFLKAVEEWAGVFDGARVDMAHLIPADLRLEMMKRARAINPRFMRLDEVYHEKEKESVVSEGVPYGKYAYEWIGNPRCLSAVLSGYFRPDNKYLKNIAHYAGNHDDIVVNYELGKVSQVIAATLGGYYLFYAFHVLYGPRTYYPVQATTKKWEDELKGKEDSQSIREQELLMKSIQQPAFESAARKTLSSSNPGILAYSAGEGPDQAIVIVNISKGRADSVININMPSAEKNPAYLLYDSIGEKFYIRNSNEMSNLYVDLEQDKAHIFFVKPINVQLFTRLSDLVNGEHKKPFTLEEIKSYISDIDTSGSLSFLFNDTYEPKTNKGSSAEGLRYLYKHKIFSKEKAISRAGFQKGRGFKKSAACYELEGLTTLGIVKVVKLKKDDLRRKIDCYYLDENFGRAPPEDARKAIDEICSIDILDKYKLPSNNARKISAIRGRVKKIIGALLPQGKKGPQSAVINRQRSVTKLPIDKRLENLIHDQEFIDLFKDSESRRITPLKDKIADLLKGSAAKEDFAITRYDEAILLVIYKDKKPYRIVRYAVNSYVDYLSGPRLNPEERHSANVLNDGFKFELLRDRPEVLTAYLEEINFYYKNPILRPIVELIWSEEYYNLRKAITDLRSLSYEFKGSKDATDRKIGEYALKLLHTLMYHKNKGIRIEANRVLHDIYTGRPEKFPQTKSYRTVLQGQDQTIEVACRRGESAARIQWAVNGKMQKPINMVKSGDNNRFSAVIPVGAGTIHYAVEVNIREIWRYKVDGSQEDRVSGVIKTQKDMRGKHILEVRTAIFDLPKGEDGKPVWNKDGSLKISNFDQLRKLLPELKKHYDGIWLMDCFEWGPVRWPGEDPSSFAPRDHITIAASLGGKEALDRLKEEANSGEKKMDLGLNLIPHISQSNTTMPAYFPVYCYSGPWLVRRDSSDGLGNWDDSFHPNWRRKEDMDWLVALAVEFAEEGYFFRGDIAHALDTVFEVDHRSKGLARIFGDVVTTDRRDNGDGCFKTTDLAGTGEPNVVLSKLAYEIQARAPNSLMYGENFATNTEDRGWQANDERLIKSGIVPYNSLHEELARVLRDGNDVSGIINHMLYRRWVHDQFGGQDVTVYASHDYQRDPQIPDEIYRDRPPLQLYGDGIIPFMATIFLLDYHGPVLWHFARLLGNEADDFNTRHSLSLAEFWKIWVNNIRKFDYTGAVEASSRYLKDNPNLAKMGDYVFALKKILEEYDIMKSPDAKLTRHDSDCMSVLKNSGNEAILGFINYGYHNKDIFRSIPELPEIGKDEIYELKELFRYTKDKGLHTSSVPEYLSGAELRNLGLHQQLSAWETAIYSIKPVKAEALTLNVLRQSMSNYKNFGVEDRVNYSLVSSALRNCIEKSDFNEFKDILEKLIKISRHTADLELGDISTVLYDISRFHPEYKNKFIDNLTRIVLEDDSAPDMDVRYDAVRILRGMQIGEVAIASLEIRDIAGLGGLALYTKDMATELVDLGLDTTVFTSIFNYNKEGGRIFESTVNSAKLEYTGRSFVVPFYGEDAETVNNFNRGYIYKTMLGGIVRTYAFHNNRYGDVLYGGITASDLIRRYRFFALGSLEAIRKMNVHPAVLQTNEGATGFAIPYLVLPEYSYLRNDAHFDGLRVKVHANHNLDRNYQNIITGDNEGHKRDLMRIAGFNPERFEDHMLVSADAKSMEINPTYAANNKSDYSVTVSPGYRDYTADNSAHLGLGDLMKSKRYNGRYAGEQNGIDTITWQKKILRQQTFFECKDGDERQKLFQRVRNNIKPAAKNELQEMIGLDKNYNACLFTMLHRLCEQKGYEIAIDAIRKLLDNNKDAQVAIGGPAEDSDQGRWFKKQIEEMQDDARYRGRFKYVGGVNPNSRLYELMYLGADVFLMPSKFEPAGLSQLEALAAGAVVIGRDIDGLSTSIIDVEEAPRRGVPANGFKFFDFNSGEFNKAMERALTVFRKRDGILAGKKMSDWDQLFYNAFTYDSRWIRPAKRYINKIYASNTDINMERTADFPELLLIFSEAEKNRDEWSKPESKHSLERRLIECGYNTDRGLDHVLEDAIMELGKIVNDVSEKRDLVRQLAKKYYMEEISPKPEEYVVKQSVSDYLIAIRDSDMLMAKASNKNEGIVLGDPAILVQVGIFIPVENKPRYYKFTDIMTGPDQDTDYTRTLMNAIISELKKSPFKAVREVIKMAIINEIDKQLVVPGNKVLWHVVENDVIPPGQKAGIVTQVNKEFRNPGKMEKIRILNTGESVADVIKEIRAENNDALIDIALSSAEHIKDVPDDKSLKMLVFNSDEDFIQLEGVIAALRALHSEDGLSMLLRLYSVMAGKPFNNPPFAISDDPKDFARAFIFDLPKAASVSANEIPGLNKRLLELLTAA